MPYIAKELRNEVDECVDALIRVAQQSVPKEKLPGFTNYLISRLTTGIINPKNYGEMATVVSTFECAKHEFIRRVMNPYEDDAIAKNGDIPEYEAFGFRRYK